MLWRKMWNVRRNREKGVCPVGQGVLFTVSTKSDSAWEKYDFSQTLVHVHSLLVQNLS